MNSSAAVLINTYKKLYLCNARLSSYLCEQARLDLKRLGSRGLGHYGNSILHPHGVTGVLGGGRLQPCAQRAHGVHKYSRQHPTSTATPSVL